MANRRTLHLVALLLLVCAVGIVYSRALNAPFIFDDLFSITGNPSITSLWPPLGDAQHPGPLNPSKDLPTAGRPLVNLSLALNYYFGQLNPVGYHIFNVVVHLLSALLLMAIVERTFCLDYFAGRFQRVSTVLALIVALLWAMHPLQTEAVVYVTQRTELLVGFFYLATLYGSLRYWAAATRASRATWLALSTLACLAGMACKEVMVTAPVIVLLFERTFISPGAPSFRRALRESWPLYLGLFITWGPLVYLNYTGPRSETAGFHLGLPAYAWWFTQTKVLVLYLKLAVWPWPLVIHYEMPYLTSPAAAWPWLVPVALLAIVTLILFLRSRRAGIGFVGACMFVLLSPTLVVPILTEVAAERRMYLPLAALAALAVVGGYALAVRLGQWIAPKASRTSISRGPVVFAGALAMVLILALSVVSARRLAAYHDKLSIWEDAALYEPNNSIVHTNLGYELTKAGRLDEAILHCEQALRLNPNIIAAHNNLGDALFKKGSLQEAMGHYHQALQIDANCALTYNNLGSALVSAGQLPQALQHYRRALELNPHYAEAHNNLGLALEKSGQMSEAIDEFQEAVRLEPTYAEAHFDLGHALITLGRLQPGIDQYQQALKFNSDYAEAYYNLGLALAGAGQIEQAIQNYGQALRLKPTYAEAHNNLANALLTSGQLPSAIEHYQEALKLQPDFAEAHNNLATALSESKRLPDAIAGYKEALRLKPDYTQAHINLGNALVQNGQLQEAVEQYQQALELARSQGLSALTQQIEDRLKEISNPTKRD